ncbi:MAG: XisI protein [Gemmataceae bacterium]
MDRVDRYRAAVRRLIEDYARIKPSVGDIETEAVIDAERDHYEVLWHGFEGHKRVHGSMIHIDIKGDKVWIQHNGTSELIADELMADGVPREAIVLGFYPPDVRKLTEFAAG